jgi:nucleotide-binding universal stress UspA family protein
MFRKILVAVDGSATSDHALQTAAGLATPGTALKVVTVADNPAQQLGLQDDAVYFKIEALREATLEQARAVLRGAQLQLEGQELAVDCQLIDQTLSLNATVAEGVLAAAAAWGADVIVVGTHGRRGIRRFLMGSVAEQIIRSALCPVLSIRHPEGGRQTAADAFAEWPEEKPIGS